MRDSDRNRPLLRERVGMALAIVAVACLSSVIVQWSTHFPEDETVLEHALFGDLVDETNATTSERRPLRQTAIVPELQPHPASAKGQDSSVALSGIEAAKRSETTPSLLVPHVRFSEPADAEPSSVQAVSYSQEDDAGWLSGVIEEDAPLDASQTRSSSSNVVQLGTIIPDE